MYIYLLLSLLFMLVYKYNIYFYYIFLFIGNKIKDKIYNYFYGVKLENFDMYSVTYYYKGYKYKILLHKRINLGILTILDHNNNDITEHLERYIGPNNDFHTIRLTPRNLGYSKLKIVVNDDVKEFYHDDLIIF